MADTFRLEKKSSLLLCLLVLLHVAGWLAMKPIWPSSDDLQYALNAVRFHPGNYHPGMNQFENRPGLFVPAALFIRVFGLSPFSIAAYPLLLSCLSIVLVFVVLNRTLGLLPAFAAGFLVATNIFQLSWTLELFPDMPVAFFSMCSVCALYFARAGTGRARINFGIMYALAGLLGFLSKESILLLSPFLGLVCLEDVMKGKHLAFWRNIWIYTSLAALFLFLLYFFWTGDPFHRLRSMYDFSTRHLIDADGENYILAGSPHTFMAWLNSKLGYVFLLVFGVPALVFFKKGKNPFIAWVLRYVLVLFLELGLLFHSHAFGIVFMQDRLWMFMVLPLAILVAAGHVQMNRNGMGIICVLLFLLCMYNYVEAGGRRALLFLLFEAAALCCMLFYERLAILRYLVLFPFLVLDLSFICANSNWGLKMQKRPAEMILPKSKAGHETVMHSPQLCKFEANADQIVMSSSMCFFSPCPRVIRPTRLFPE